MQAYYKRWFLAGGGYKTRWWIIY